MKILITGASSGIGRALANLLSEKENDLILAARDPARLEAVRGECLAAGAKSVTVRSVDLSQPENCVALHEEFPDVDFLINNAGFGDLGRFTETDLEKELRMIGTNVTAVHVLFKLYLKTMTERDAGRILTVASIAGFMPGPLMATYYATKAYVVRLNESVLKELKKRRSRVKISILCPGPVKTGFEKAANIHFNFHGTDVNKVARYALKRLDRFYIVPCFPVRISRFFLKIAPAPLISSFIYRAQNGRMP